MTLTKLANLVNPEVMADMVSAKLPAAIKFSPLAKMDYTLVGRPGNTITVPKYKYIGDAQVVAEGQPIDISLLQTETDTATIVKYGKAIELPDEAVLSGYGDPIGNAVDQIVQSIAAAVDNASLEALQAAPLFVGDGTAAISEALVYDATDRFEDEEDEVKVLFIAPAQAKTVRNDPGFLKPIHMAEYGITPVMDGVIGVLGDCQVVVSRKMEADQVTGTYNNVIVKEGALTLFLKRDVEVESDRDITTKTTVISADEHVVAYLNDDSKAVRLITKA
ncbi:N4-gp56 family major capsid protein [Lysinibacillus irui]|uniref:N4-gp56 family major capsid protein n=1 Tax=Lysinibacillus irui TaxID=2998077 RepID=A0ABU5NJE3_9BACI|nr:N4-gp56 family major capsid protein [Lysinibacillus irui]MEA0553768.1 N4-gp56 family major capsid protein [Lysinibacillus irui]MEA0976152.1 N4-gp56 family major capsid protein [Lysinibacillus irui]MEA1042306.1 N4-gp56 family major capsid protein [Lysinibacillus irui]